jgi:hypothetical protein
MNCRVDPQKTRDSLCSDEIGQVSGFNVNRVQVTGTLLVRHKDGTLVSGS